MESTENKMQQWALSYASLGLYVFPLIPGQKRPALSGWQEASTRDAEQIKAWWAQNPTYNIGIDTGKSGLIVIDYDAANGKTGLQIREEWRNTHAPRDTWTARTPRGGLYEYYKGQGKTQTGLYKGVDVRAAGGLVVAPPSVFDGRAYRWEKPPGLYQLAETNEAVKDFLAPETDGQKRKDRYTVPESIPEGGRTSALVSLAGSLIGKGLSPEAAEAAIREENEQRCEPPLTEEELQREVFPALRRGWDAGAPYTRDMPIRPQLLERLKELDPANNKRFGLNDAGSARLFIEVCSTRVLYAEDRKKWLFYDGVRWDADGENAVKEELKLLANALTIYGLQCVNDDKRAEYLKYAAKWQQLNTRETILKDAASVSPVKSDRFDRQPFLLNVQNGTLDLNTFELRPHDAKDYLSRVAAVKYDPEATAPRWLQFIDEVTAEKETGKARPDLARYIQKAVGYALTGDTRHECLFILYGATSRNGKSTLLETLAAMLGDYAKTANPETFTKQKYVNGSQHSEDIARLAGVRFVTVSEPPQGMELNASLVKSLTGRDSITTRRMHESFFEYVPQFKLFFNTNHRPRVDDMTVFASGRVKMIPFDVHFGEGQRDPNLKAELQKPESLSGILNWALEGLRLLRDEGFGMPEAVTQATDDYRRKQDKIGRFLEEKTEAGAGFEVPIMDLHSAFTFWCEQTGAVPIGVAKFREMLEEKQITVKRKRPNGAERTASAVTFACGIKLV